MNGKFCRRVMDAQGPVHFRGRGIIAGLWVFACGRKTNASRSRHGWRLALLLAGRYATLLFGLLGLCVGPAAAAENPAPKADAAQSSPGAAPSPEQLSSAASNPNAPLTQLQLRNVAAPALPGFGGTGNVLQLQGILPLKPSALIPFATIMKLTVPLASLPAPVDQTTLGSIQYFAQAVFNESWGSWGAGVSVVAPTDTFTRLPRPSWQVGPAAALIYTGIPNLVFGGVFQNPIPVGAGQTSLIFTPSITYSLPDGWYAGYPDFDWISKLGKRCCHLSGGSASRQDHPYRTTTLQHFGASGLQRCASGERHRRAEVVNRFRVHRAVPGALGTRERSNISFSSVRVDSTHFFRYRIGVASDEF